MALLLQIGHQVLPEQTSELVLSCSGRQVRSLVTCPLALCTSTRHTQVGQEGIGEADQMQVDNCRPIRAILVVAQPQQLLTVLKELRNFPAPVVRLDEPSSRHLRVVGDQPKDLAGGPCAREDDMQATELAHLQPPGIEIAVTDLPMGLHEHERGGTAPPTQVPAVAAGFELPAVCAEAAIAFQRGGNVKVLLPAGLHDGVTQRVGVKQDHDLDASGGLELPDELGRQCGGVPEGDAHGPTVRFFDIQPDAPGDHLLAEDQDAAHILVALDIRVARRVLHLGHRVHHFAPFRLLGIIDEQKRGSPRWGAGLGATPEPSGAGRPRGPTAQPRRSY